MRKLNVKDTSAEITNIIAHTQMARTKGKKSIKKEDDTK